MRLFADRAVDAGAETAWDALQLAAVGEICRRVDGIPLAIELAAARTASMSPADVASHLDERFRLLTGKRRGRVERHQTLRATVEWSYQLLDDDERLVFDRLGVFAGTFDAPAAVAVAGGDDLDSWEITEAISSLVAKSMLVPETGADGTTRYGMLETLRQFARERLDDDQAHRRPPARARRHIRNGGPRHRPGHNGPEDVLWVGRLRADLDNVRAAVGWALDRDDPDEQELALRILAPLSWISQNCSDLAFDLLATRAAPLAEDAEPSLRTPVLTLAGYHYWQQGDLEQARAFVERAIDAGIVTDLINPLDPYVMLVAIEMTAGNHVRAFEALEAARVHFDDTECKADVARALGGFATFEAMAGRIDAALADSEHAMQLAQSSGNLQFLANVLNGRAWGAPARRSRRCAGGRGGVRRDLSARRRGAQRRTRSLRARRRPPRPARRRRGRVPTPP